MKAARSQPRKAVRPRGVRGPFSAIKHDDFLIVAIGISAGGLDACKRLIDALPADNAMAFLIVQHLEPSRESLLVDLLSTRTSMQVVAMVVAVIMIPVSLLVRRPPALALANSRWRTHPNRRPAREPSVRSRPRRIRPAREKE